MNTTSKIAIGAGGALVLIGAWAYKKKTAFDEVITQMTMDISNIHNLHNKGLKAFFDCDITFKNNTNTEFSITGAGLIFLKRISVYHLDKGKKNLLGNAFSNTQQFSLPAKGQQIITGVSVELLSLNLLNQLLGGTLDGNPANYTFEVELVALGKTFIIEQ